MSDRAVDVGMELFWIEVDLQILLCMNQMIKTIPESFLYIDKISKKGFQGLKFDTGVMCL